MSEVIQTKEWEAAYVKTRRNTKLRTKRLMSFSMKNDDRVLDLGCGDGLDVKILREHGIWNVTGMDISRDLIASARERNPKNKFVFGDANNLPFRDDSFDVVLVNSVFHHLMEYGNPIREIKRVLVPGGCLCFIEPKNNLLRKVFDYLTFNTPLFKARRIGLLEEEKLIKHWLVTEDEFQKELFNAGFVKEFNRTELMGMIGKYIKSPSPNERKSMKKKIGDFNQEFGELLCGQ